MGNTQGFSLLSAGDDYDAQPSRSFFAFSSQTDVRMCAMVTIIDDDSFERMMWKTSLPPWHRHPMHLES